MTTGSIFQSLRRLACFAAIADAGSIKGGARRLGLSVPVVSTALAELEEELAVKLAVRTTRKLELTPAGHSVYARTQQMLSSADEALNVASSDLMTEGELRLTFPVELGSHWLPPHLLQFHQTFPGIKLQIDAEDTMVPLNSSEYDVAIQANYQAPGYVDPAPLASSSITLRKINLVCVAANRPRIRWAGNTAIMNCPLMTMKWHGQGLKAIDRKKARAIELRGREQIKTNNHETALALVKEGLGVVMIMEDTVRDDLAARHLVRVMPGYDFGHLTVDLKIRDSLPSPPTRAFVQFIQQQSSPPGPG